jgi:hypothetical protein
VNQESLTAIVLQAMKQIVHRTGITTDLNVNTVEISSCISSESVLNTKGKLLVEQEWQ